MNKALLRAVAAVIAAGSLVTVAPAPVGALPVLPTDAGNITPDIDWSKFISPLVKASSSLACTVVSAAWRHFWALERPDSPTADDALACIRSVGIDAVLETFDEPAPPANEPDDALVRHTRIRLCLTPDRDPEVREFLRAHPRGGRQLATIWWDVTSR
ncbi:MAG: hypothetical protein ACO36A_02785 [Ilumatobacteraceae bacterium]